MKKKTTEATATTKITTTTVSMTEIASSQPISFSSTHCSIHRTLLAMILCSTFGDLVYATANFTFRNSFTMPVYFKAVRFALLEATVRLMLNVCQIRQ